MYFHKRFFSIIVAAVFSGVACASTAIAGSAPTKQSAIDWPQAYLPGTTDNFVSNEVIVAGLTAADIWPFLSNATLWPSYYKNSADVRFYDHKGPVLADHDRFFFKTFGFPVEAQVTELSPPNPGSPGRVTWHGWTGEGDKRLDVIHAWLVEDLSGGRVRILTQESQKGTPAKELHMATPNPMINGHQDWLNGLVQAARDAK